MTFFCVKVWQHFSGKGRTLGHCGFEGHSLISACWYSFESPRISGILMYTVYSIQAKTSFAANNIRKYQAWPPLPKIDVYCFPPLKRTVYTCFLIFENNTSPNQNIHIFKKHTCFLCSTHSFFFFMSPPPNPKKQTKAKNMRGKHPTLALHCDHLLFITRACSPTQCCVDCRLIDIKPESNSAALIQPDLMGFVSKAKPTLND